MANEKNLIESDLKIAEKKLAEREQKI